VIYLERGRRDFTERDRAILELLRPSLIRIQQAAHCTSSYGDRRALAVDPAGA
jgi:hypothetical protein